jgi:hypothetical protein
MKLILFSSLMINLIVLVKRGEMMNMNREPRENELIQHTEDRSGNESGLMKIILSILNHPEYLSLSSEKQMDILNIMFKIIEKQYKQDFENLQQFENER